MDQTAAKPTGIPRLSKLPLPRASPTKSVKPSPSKERLHTDHGLNVSRLGRPSKEFNAPPSPSPSRSSKSVTTVDSRYAAPRPESRSIPKDDAVLKKPVGEFSRQGLPSRTNGTPKALWRQPGRAVDNASETTNMGLPSRQELHPLPKNEDGALGKFETSKASCSEPENLDLPKNRRKPRPSLSDRTVETLSQLPPSPSPTRRKSSFFPLDTPMGPPSRPASAMNHSRPSSRLQSTDFNGFRSISPTKRALASSPTKTQGSRRVSTPNPPVPALPSQSSNLNTPAAPKRESSKISLLNKSKVYGGSKSMAVRPSKPRATLSTAFAASEAGDITPSSDKIKTPRRPPSAVSASSITSPSSPASTTSSRISAASKSNATEGSVRKTSKSSSALRESIAKAKAARKAGRESSGSAPPQDVFDEFTDPSNLRSQQIGNRGILLKRVEAGRTSGYLNIAAMGMKQIPDEVMTMYEFDPSSTGEWYESVDLVKFIAADNEIEELREDAFPDLAPDGLMKAEKGNQFGGLEALDLHGNSLRDLPLGLRRLERLHSLNVSNNRLVKDSLDLLTQIESLKELKLANNRLEGALTPNFSRLTKLETLDVHGNMLTELPECLSELVQLKALHVADNRLISLPFDSMSSLPLIELVASKNKLQGTLLPESITLLPSLQILNVANNALYALSTTQIDLPSLQQLNIDCNRIASLPDLTSWRSLLTITAADNRLEALPYGFVTLEALKNVDFAGNNLTKLDDQIGLMENLAALRIANNPLRDRKFLTMNTDDLKRDLRNGLTPEILTVGGTDELGQEGPSVTSEQPESTWNMKAGGLLDLSSKSLSTLDPSEVSSFLSTSHDVRSLQIHHNRLMYIPIDGLSLLSQTLTSLDLSHNVFNDHRAISYISSHLALPHLQTLNLSSTGLLSITPLTTYLSAPSLAHLEISCNRLSGAFPVFRSPGIFPNLTILLASDNTFSDLSVEAVRGLRVLDVRNNEIVSLPPKLGLLGGNKSLRTLEVGGNRFRVPRWQIVEKGTEAVLEYLRGRVPVDEIVDGYDSVD